MCRAVRCKTCDKTTWSGCGQHVANVKSGVPAGQWCNGQHSPAEKAAASGAGKAGGGLWSRLTGRD